MSILIIGGTGYLGMALGYELTNRGYITYLTTTKLQNKKNDLGSKSNQISFIQCTLIQTKKLIKIIEEKKIETVIHLASRTVPASNRTDFVDELKEIISPTISLLPELARRKIKFVFISSGGSIYDKEVATPTLENSATNPEDYYGLSKYVIEKAVKLSGYNEGLKYLIIRPSNVYGPKQTIRYNQGIIPKLINSALNDKKIEIWGDGTNIRDYIFIDDFVEFLIQCLKKDAKNCEINISTGVGTSILDLIHLVETISGNKINYEKKDVKNSIRKVSILDNSKLKKIVPNKNFTTIQEGLANCISNYYV